jgi:hypothetical protein
MADRIKLSECVSDQWAWWDAEKQAFRHVYPNELCVRICSPDHFKTAETEGRGRVMRVKVVGVEEEETEK